MLANVVLLLGNASQLLAAVNVDACLRLAKHRSALNFVKFSSHLFWIDFYSNYLILCSF